MTREEMISTVNEFMDSLNTMNLSCSVEDKPWAAAVYFARQGYDLVFFSSPSSRHSLCFEKNNRAAATIHGEYQSWKEIKGIQMEGRVERISGMAAIAGATATYLKRFPFVKDFFSDPSSIATGMSGKMADVALYVFRTESIYFMSNEVDFGVRWKISIHNGQPVGDPVQA